MYMYAYPYIAEPRRKHPEVWIPLQLTHVYSSYTCTCGRVPSLYMPEAQIDPQVMLEGLSTFPECVCSIGVPLRNYVLH